ncbi:hypothetical protein EJ08DRAFT_338623 [Tothia fuscella]|uniref:Uncharacterized protein n=1 Tax=Tothia fuscella TaxID=1048955 RepID=A0A9P4NZN5_9PEZI|nr:hypothetical protein EJ08DRAFT_338623 [Tothia fuscella]
MAETNPFSPTRLPMPASSIPTNITQPAKAKANASKRRSLLLPPGSLMAASQRNSTLAPPEAPTASRPMTMFEGDMQSLAAEEEDARAAAHARLTGESSATTTNNNARSRVGLPRSQSMRKAGPAVDTTRSLRSAHGRNTSNMSGSGYPSRPLSTLSETKRPSRPGSVASTASAKSPTDNSMPPPRTKLPSSVNSSTSLRRTASTASNTSTKHTRTQSALPTSANRSSIALPRPTDLRRRPTFEDGKPAFSTLQQHFSPQKNTAPKPASSSLIHARSNVETTATLSLDTQFLQARLLQLSIMHQQSGVTLHKWEDDARRKLHRKFDSVVAKCDSVQQMETRNRKLANVDALREWGAGDSGLLAENVQVLAGVVTEVMQLVESEGRVQGILDIFSEWIQWVGTIWESREHSNSQAEVEFIEGLGEPWRAEVRALIRKLGNMGRVLDGLERPKEGSSLGSLVDGVVRLVAGVLEELKVVLKLENEGVEKEKRWVDETMARLDRQLLL